MRYPTDAAARSLSVLVVFTLFAGDFWRDLISWWGYLALVGALTVLLAVVMTRRKLWSRLPLRRMPRTLVLFGVLAVVSLAWSFYPGATVLGLVAQAATTLAALFICVSLSWPQLLAALSTAFAWILGLSLVFELVIAVFVRQPVLPFFTDYGDTVVPKAFYWSQGLLFQGGPIQGIVGNRNILAFVAVLALIVFGVQLAQKLRRPRPTIAWIAIAVIVLALTRSATAIGALVVTALMLGVLLLARRAGHGRRVWVLAGVVVVSAGAIVAVSTFWQQVLGLFGKSEDLTGRVDIWNAVAGLAAQRPAFGWGWVSYWAPWVEPFNDLAVRRGVVYLQAHDAWLDVWFQLGFVGLALFVFLVVATWYRAWWFAVDRPLDSLGLPISRVPLTLAPALLLTAMIAQSFVESRMLVEGGWLLLVVFAVKTKLDQSLVAIDLGNDPEAVNPRPSRAALALEAHRPAVAPRLARKASARR
ncbi:O-antigen ligase family protein [Herbiconiux daphne]|uniref:O-antigen ligase family protein n=1 Tax=Herbiconiux daphne TaxID=2970914 RepID=A0ABT2H4S2_9MICO|nr:O-antigen ligase family protein [Herbiconiux daphne]MCS5734914.1 O-antigen ligase family protein [Herbiconiux daphne]